MAESRDLKRILLVRNDGIGDMVLTLPAMAAVRRCFPRAHLAALVSRASAAVVAASGSVDELLVDRRDHNVWQLAQRLKPMQFDAALVFNTNTRNSLAVWRAGISRRVCWAYRPIGMLLGNRRVALRRSHPPIHESEFAMAFARRIGAESQPADFAPSLEIDTATENRVIARIARDVGSSGPLFGVHPLNNDSAFNWPTANYVELIGRLTEHGRVIVTGSPQQRSAVERIRYRMDEAQRKRVGFYFDWELLEFAAAVRALTVLTVSSTGPMHLAGILGTPIVALFSPNPVHSPKKWAPLGDQHTILMPTLAAGENPYITRAQAPEVMGRISVDEVLAANLKCVAESRVRASVSTGAADQAA